MKKIFTLVFVLCLMCSTSVLADNSNRQTELKATIQESYIIVIPATLDIPFNSTSTNLPIEVKSLRLLSTGTKENTDRALCVHLEQPDFKLTNEKDESSKITYDIDGGEGTYERYHYFTETETKNYIVSIAQSEWDAAAAGTYKNTVTFEVYITDISKK